MNISVYYYTSSVRLLLPFSALQTGSSAGRWKKKNISVGRSRRIEQPFSRVGHKVYQSNIRVLKAISFVFSLFLFLFSSQLLQALSWAKIFYYC